MTKHTPGPWEFVSQPVKEMGFYIQTVDHMRKDSFVGEVGGGLQDLETVKANALLIHAAPELLAALDELYTIASLRCAHEIDEEVLTNAKAAIAKATQTT